MQYRRVRLHLLVEPHCLRLGNFSLPLPTLENWHSCHRIEFKFWRTLHKPLNSKKKRIKIIEFSHATTFYFAMRHAEKLPRIRAMVLCFSHQQHQIRLELVTAVPDTVFLKKETMCWWWGSKVGRFHFWGLQLPDKVHICSFLLRQLAWLLLVF